MCVAGIYWSVTSCGLSKCENARPNMFAETLKIERKRNTDIVSLWSDINHAELVCCDATSSVNASYYHGCPIARVPDVAEPQVFRLPPFLP